MSESRFSPERGAHSRQARSSQTWGSGQPGGRALTGSHRGPRRSARPAAECSDGFDLRQGGSSKARHLDGQGSVAEADGLWAVLAPAPAWTSLLLSWDCRPVCSRLIARADVATAARRGHEPRVAARRWREARQGPRAGQGGPASASRGGESSVRWGLCLEEPGLGSGGPAAWRLGRGIRQTWRSPGSESAT